MDHMAESIVEVVSQGSKPPVNIYPMVLFSSV